MVPPPVNQLDELLEAYKAGDLNAFDIFFRQSRDIVYSYALQRIKNPEKAADVTQDIYLRVHRYILSFKKEEGLAIGWIYGIARNCVADHFREHHAEQLHFVSNSLNSNFDALTFDDRTFFYDLVTSLEKQMPKDDIEMLLERVITELSFKEIAEKRGINSANARQRFSRILRKIRENF